MYMVTKLPIIWPYCPIWQAGQKYQQYGRSWGQYLEFYSYEYQNISIYPYVHL